MTNNNIKTVHGLYVAEEEKLSPTEWAEYDLTNGEDAADLVAKYGAEYGIAETPCLDEDVENVLSALYAAGRVYTGVYGLTVTLVRA